MIYCKYCKSVSQDCPEKEHTWTGYVCNNKNCIRFMNTRSTYIQLCEDCEAYEEYEPINQVTSPENTIVILTPRQAEVMRTLLSAEIMKLDLHYGSQKHTERQDTCYSIRNKLMGTPPTRVTPVLIDGEYDRNFQAGDLVQHFKGGLYKIISIATHTETEEPMVVYQSLQGENQGRVWVRPYEMFCSPVDKIKYPKAESLYRMTKVKEN